MAGRQLGWYDLLVKGQRDPGALEEVLERVLHGEPALSWDVIHHILDALLLHEPNRLGPRARGFQRAVLERALDCPCNELAHPQARITCLKAREEARKLLAKTPPHPLARGYQRVLDPCQAARGLARHLGIIDPQPWHTALPAPG